MDLKVTVSYVKKYCLYVFTLVELLVVISIIAILASILLPVLKQAKTTARRAACQGNEKQISYGLMMYANDFNGQGPSGTYKGSGHVYNAATLSGYVTPKKLADTVEWSEILACPDTKPPFSDSGPYRAGNVSKGLSRAYSSYILTFGTGNRTTANWHGWTPQTSTISSESRVQCPNVKMLNRVVDGRYIASPSRQPMLGDISSKTGFIVAFGHTATPFLMSHNGSNTAFMDGHVEWIPRDSFKWYVHFYYSSARLYF